MLIKLFESEIKQVHAQAPDWLDFDISGVWSCFQAIYANDSTRTGTEGDKNTPKPGHGHSINTDKPKQNSFSQITMKLIEFSFRKSIPDRFFEK